MRRHLPFIALILCLAACSDAPATMGRGPRTDADETTLRIGNEGEVRSLDPQKVSTLAEGRVVQELYDGLTDYDGEGGIVPSAATGWTVSADGLDWRFTLRPGLAWSNGDPITAADFVYTLRRAVDPKTASTFAALLAPIRNAEAVTKGDLPPEALGVAAPDPATVEIRLARPFPSLTTVLAHHIARAVPRAAVEAHGPEWTRPENIVTSGAFTLKSWALNSRLVMNRNPHFWDAGHVALRTLVILPIEDSSAGVRRYRAGEVDLLFKYPASQYPALKAGLGDEVHKERAAATRYYVFNTRKPPFNDARVRKALNLLINRTILTQKVLSIGFPATSSVVPDGLSGYRGLPDVKPDPVEAQALLAAAGYGPDRPLRFNLSYATDEDNRKLTVAVAYMWRQAGIEAQPENVEATEQSQRLRTGNFDVALGTWAADYPDPENFLFMYQRAAGPMNYSGDDNPEFDRLLAAARAEPDPSKRLEGFRAAEERLMRDVPVMPVFNLVFRSIAAPWVQGFNENMPGQHPVRHLSVRCADLCGKGKGQ